MKKYYRYYRYFALLSVLVLLAPFFTLKSATVDELKKGIDERTRQIKELEKEIAAYQDALESQQGVSQSLNGEIKKLETQIKKLNADIRLTQTEIQKTELVIEDLSGEIRSKEQNITADSAALGELIRAIHESDENSLLEIMLTEGSISDFFDNVGTFETVSDGIKEKIISLQEHKKMLEGERDNRETEQKSLQNLRRDLSGKKSAQESVNSTKKKLLSDSKNQETRFQKLVKSREAERQLIQRELEDIENELRRLIDPSSLPPKRSGFFGWPLMSPYVTQRFGFTDFAISPQGIRIYKNKGHNGVDFRAALGTPIFAVADGIVKDFGDTDTVCPGGSYGRWVVIDHGNNLLSLYGHLSSVAVVRGGQVKRGDRVAYSGATGNVTGPHLHFMVYAANTYRFVKSNYCGMIPAGGYLDPNDYLPSL